MFLAWELGRAQSLFSAGLISKSRKHSFADEAVLKPINANREWTNYEEVLISAKQRLQEFIRKLGNLALQPLDLTKFESDFSGEVICDYVDLSVIQEAVDNSIRKMRSNKKIKTNWSRQDLLLLLWIIEHYNRLHHKTAQQYVNVGAIQNSQDWQTVGSLVPGKNGEQAMFKWLSLKSNKMPQRRDWQLWEDECLARLVRYGCSLCRENHQRKWFKISKELYLQTENQLKRYRSAKQCRQRWTCYLNPILKKGNWTYEEDFILFSQFLNIGKRWSAITKQLKGRTENAVKNRWKLVMEKFERHKKGPTGLRNYFENYLKTLEHKMKKTTLSSAITSVRSIEVENSETITTHQKSRASTNICSSEQQHFEEVLSPLRPILELPPVQHFPLEKDLQEHEFGSLIWTGQSRNAQTTPSVEYNSISEESDLQQQEQNESLNYFITDNQRFFDHEI